MALKSGTAVYYIYFVLIIIIDYMNFSYFSLLFCVLMFSTVAQCIFFSLSLLVCFDQPYCGSMDLFVSVSIFGVQMTATEGDNVINNYSPLPFSSHANLIKIRSQHLLPIIYLCFIVVTWQAQ